MGNMKILAGPNSEQLAQKIAEQLNLKLLDLSYKYFTDGETYFKIEGNFKKEDVIIVQTTYPNQEKRLLELIFLTNTLKELGADKVIAVVPYLCYARADRRRLDGEVVSHNITMDLLQQAGLDSLITINVHNREAFHKTAESLEKYVLSAVPAISDFLKDKVNEEWIIVGPDKGSQEDINTLSKELSLTSFILEKYRNPQSHEVLFKEADFDCESKTIILFDDVITSGGTAIKASKILLDKKPSSLKFIVVHGLSDFEVFKKMYDIGVDTILSTNTVPRKDIEQIDISSLISNFIGEKFL